MTFPKLQTFSKLIETLSRTRDPNTTQMNTFVRFACRPAVDDDVICGVNVKTLECYAVVNFEVAISSCFRELKNHFVTAAADIDDSIKRKRIHVSLKKNK